MAIFRRQDIVAGESLNERLSESSINSINRKGHRSDWSNFDATLASVAASRDFARPFNGFFDAVAIEYVIAG